MAKIDTYNLSTLLSFRYEAALLMQKIYQYLSHDATFPCYLCDFAVE